MTVESPLIINPDCLGDNFPFIPKLEDRTDHRLRNLTLLGGAVGVASAMGVGTLIIEKHLKGKSKGTSK